MVVVREEDLERDGVILAGAVRGSMRTYGGLARVAAAIALTPFNGLVDQERVEQAIESLTSVILGIMLSMDAELAIDAMVKSIVSRVAEEFDLEEERLMELINRGRAQENEGEER